MKIFAGEPVYRSEGRPTRVLTVCVVLSLLAHAASLAGVGVSTPAPLWNSGQPLEVVAMPSPSRLIAPAVVSEIAAKVPTGRTEVAQWHPQQSVATAVQEKPVAIVLPAASEDEIFFRPWELEQRAEPKSPIVFSFPDVPPDTSPVGIVRVELRIDETGKVVAAEVLDAKPPKVFDQAALQALTGVAFTPAMRHGKAVKSLKVTEIVFERDGAPKRLSTIVGGGEALPERSVIVGERRE